MKVIFLDFDGVITIPPKWHLNPDKIKYIKRIVEKTDAKIVVSSSWRHGLERNFEWALEDMPDNEMIIWLRDNILDITPTVGLGNGRGGEIQQWLNEHPDVDNYVILDDDGDMWDSQLYHFVQTNYENGIGEAEVIYAIKILNRLYVYNWLGLNFELRGEWQKKCQGLPNKVEELKQYNDLAQDFHNRYTNTE